MKKLIILLVFSVLTSLHVYSSESKNHREWIGVFSKKEFKPGYSYWNEFQWRFNADQGRTQQTLFRFDVLKSLSQAHEVGLLIGFVETSSLQEKRPTLQHVYMTNFAETNFISLRSRLELRDIEKNSDQSLRYRLQAGIRHVLSSQYSIVFSDEIFANMTREDWSGDRLIDRNRAFVGLRMDQTYGRWEVGYLNQYVPRSHGSIQEHVAVIYFFF